LLREGKGGGNEEKRKRRGQQKELETKFAIFIWSEPAGKRLEEEGGGRKKKKRKELDHPLGIFGVSASNKGKKKGSFEEGKKNIPFLSLQPEGKKRKREKKTRKGRFSSLKT